MTNIQTLSAGPQAAGARSISGTTANTFARRAAGDPHPDQHGRGSDTVELSDRARELARPPQANVNFRTDLVQRIRTEIESGTYETQDKLDIAADRLTRDLNLLG